MVLNSFFFYFFAFPFDFELYLAIRGAYQGLRRNLEILVYKAIFVFINDGN